MKGVHQRSAVPQSAKLARPPGPSSQGAAHQRYLLELQRSAGNAAVASLLRGAPAGTRTRDTGAAGSIPVVVLQRDYDAEDFTKVAPGTGTGPPTFWTGQRPSQVSDRVAATGVPSRGRTATAQAYEQTGPHGPAVNPLLGYDGGHLIGLHLGGPNVSDNVVPMFPGFNRGAWKNMEDATKTHIATNHGTYRMNVTLAYTAATAPEVPTTFTVLLERKNPSGGWAAVSPAITLSQPADIVRTPRLSPGQERAVNPDGTAPRTPLTTDLPAENFLLGELSFSEYVNKHGHLPRSATAFYPDDPAKRPYEILDIQRLNGVAAGAGIAMTTAVGSFTDFSAEQRTLILQANMARHGGQLRSDDPGDPQQVLDQRGAANAPEIDHIVPKSLGGSNFFSNARVISWQLNNKEARVKPLSGLVDLTRLKFPALPRPLRDQAEVIVEQALARRQRPDFSVPEILAWAVPIWNLNVTTRLVENVRTVLDEFVTDRTLTRDGDRYQKA